MVTKWVLAGCSIDDLAIQLADSAQPDGSAPVPWSLGVAHGCTAHSLHCSQYQANTLSRTLVAHRLVDGLACGTGVDATDQQIWNLVM